MDSDVYNILADLELARTPTDFLRVQKKAASWLYWEKRRIILAVLTMRDLYPDEATWNSFVPLPRYSARMNCGIVARNENVPSGTRIKNTELRHDRFSPMEGASAFPRIRPLTKRKISLQHPSCSALHGASFVLRKSLKEKKSASTHVRAGRSHANLRFAYLSGLESGQSRKGSALRHLPPTGCPPFGYPARAPPLTSARRNRAGPLARSKTTFCLRRAFSIKASRAKRNRYG